MDIGEAKTVEIKLAQGPVFGENNMVLQQFYAAPTETPKPVAPFPPSELCGRDDALGELAKRLERDPRSGVVAVWGVAGVGKSTLVSALATSQQDRFPDGCLWCDLRQARGDTRIVLDTIARALGQDPRLFPDTQSMNQRIRSILSDRNILLVLDNVATTGEIEPLVALANPKTSPVVITTRSQQVALDLADDPLKLPPLSPAFSEELLRRVSNLPQDATLARLAEAAGGIPLLIQTIGRQIRRARPKKRAMVASELDTRLMSPSYRLDLLAGDVPYRDMLLLNYESVGPTAKTIIKLMGVLGSHPADIEMVRGILDLSYEDADEAIEALIDLALAVERPAGQLHLQGDVHALAKELAEDAGESQPLRSKAALYLKGWLERESEPADVEELLAKLRHYLVLIEDSIERGDWDDLEYLTHLTRRPTRVWGQLGMVYNTSWPLAQISVSLQNQCYLAKADWIGMTGGNLTVNEGWVREWRLAGGDMGNLTATASTLSRLDMRGLVAGNLTFDGCNLESLDLRGARFGNLILNASRATNIRLDDAECGTIAIHDSVVSDCDFTKARCGTITVTGNGYLIDCRIGQEDSETAGQQQRNDDELGM